MKRIVIAITAILLPIFADAGILEDRASKFDLKNSLVLDQKWVPYPDYSDRAGWDSLLGQYKDDLIKQGEKYLHFDWLVLRATDYLDYNRTGNRYTQESRISKNAEALSQVMIAELAEGKGRFMDDIINGVFLFCEYTSWAVSDHLFKFQKSNSPIPDYKDNMMALMQGNHAQLLSWTWYFFHKEFDKADPAFSERLEYEIRRKELEPYINRNDFDWMGFKPNIKPNNWNPWCNSNAILSFMLVENDRDALFAGISKAIASLDKYLEAIPSDGACDEGTEYWYKSAGNLMLCLECLEMITGGKLKAWDEPLIRRFGEFIANANIEGKWQANFADAKPTTEPNVSVIYQYGKAAGSKLLRDYAVSANKLVPFDPVDADWVLFYRALENLIAFRDVLNAADNGFTPEKFVSYPETELCYMRSGKGYLAVKGGHNKERHNHNDVGSFIYFYNSQPVFVDAGPGTYNKQTFDKRYRYKIWNIGSNWHNVPQINGVAQEYGRDFKACGTKADSITRSFTTDIAGAYPDSADVRSWVRTLRLGKTGSLVITESFEMKNAPHTCEIHFLSVTKPVITLGKVSLNAGLTLSYDSKDLEACYDTVQPGDTGVSRAYGEVLYRICLKTRTPLLKGSFKFRIQ